MWAHHGARHTEEVEQDLTVAFSRSPGRCPRWRGRGRGRGSLTFASSPWRAISLSAGAGNAPAPLAPCPSDAPAGCRVL